MRVRSGFTIIEILLVATLIAVIVAVAIPGYHRAKRSANESAALTGLRTLNTASEQYRVRFGTYASQLTDLRDAQFVDSVLGNAGVAPGKSGYLFEYQGTESTWLARARPVLAGFTGERYFFIDQRGVIHFSETGAATESDPPLE
jgi:prepilin-type N-terminal cleavage/methylation domain-containing protein